MDFLLLIGLTIFFGTLGAKLSQQFKIPQVCGYIFVGLVLGQAGLQLWTTDAITRVTPIINLALGVIGFLIGSELKFDVFRRHGKSIYTILVFEGVITFLVVGGVFTLLTGKLYYGLLFGALASATAPAATVDVLWEYKARGPLSSTILAIVALDDILALLIYAFAAILAKSIIVHEHFTLVKVGHTGLEILLGMGIGALGGFILYWLTYFIKDRERILPFSFSVIAVIIGLSAYYKIDIILASMLAGLTLANMAPVESEEIFGTIKKFSSPIYAIFFVLVGARLNPELMIAGGMMGMVIVYVVSRCAGKMTGAYLGGLVGKAAPSVRKYLGMSLFSQAGVALGLAMSMYNNLSHFGAEATQIGLTVVNVIVSTTLIVQFMGPPCVKLAIEKAGEMWKNVTEDDVVDSYKVEDLVERGVPVIYDNTPLPQLVSQVKECESDDFCVVDDHGRLLGSISIGDLRDVLFEQRMELHQLVLAKDVLVPARRVITANRPLKEALDILKRRDLDFLLVVKNEKTRELVGIIHYRFVMSEIQKKLLALRG